MGFYMADEPSSADKGTDTYHHGDLRAALIREAVAEVERTGPQGVKLSVLAKRAGVTQGAPYRHFADRKALMEAVAVEGYRILNRFIRAGDTGAEPKVRAIAHAYLEFARVHRGLYRLLFATRTYAETPPDSALRREAMAGLEILAAPLSPPGNRTLGVRRAIKLWAALHGIVMLDDMGILTGGSADTSIDALAEDIVAEYEALEGKPA